MNSTKTNRYGDALRLGQLWLDSPDRTSQRTLRVDALADAGSLGTVAISTVISFCNQATGETSHPNRVVEINIDRLHTTRTGRGYRLAPSQDL